MRKWMWIAALALGAGIPDVEAKPTKNGNPPRSVPQVAVGDPLPDVPVLRPDGTPVSLAEHKKPDRALVLIFGSFT